MSAATIIIRHQKRLIRLFREAGAVDEDHAISLESLGERRSWIFNRMVRHSVFLVAQGGRYYMDEQAAEIFLRERRNRALFLGLLLLLLFLLFWVLGILRR